MEIVLVILFLLWVNFLPPLASLLLKHRFQWPLDFGLYFLDDNPLLGPHKTIRGVVFALLGSLLFAPVLQLRWQIVLASAALAVSGDVLTSFIKRRFNRQSGAVVIGLDQFFEGVLPTMFLAGYLDLSVGQVIIILVFFIPITYFGSEFWQYLTIRPPRGNPLRIIRSAARIRSWRACHQPLARWQALLNFEMFFYYRILMTLTFKAAGLYEKGIKNSLLIETREETFTFADLPEAFNGFRIMLLTDLHLDSIPELTDTIIEKIKDLQVDMCLIGGDIRMELYGSITASMHYLRRIKRHIRAKHETLGVLGNHDCIEMVPDLEDVGVIMLVNDSWYIEKNGQKIWIVGIDDPHYYKVHDLEAAYREVPKNAWTLFLSHSPEIYKEAAEYTPKLFLCGHTHGGQVCLPGHKAIFTHCKAPRYACQGRWSYKGMHGYTSSGVGPSGVPVRFNCPGEISLITLKKSPS